MDRRVLTDRLLTERRRHLVTLYTLSKTVAKTRWAVAAPTAPGAIDRGTVVAKILIPPVCVAHRKGARPGRVDEAVRLPFEGVRRCERGAPAPTPAAGPMRVLAPCRPHLTPLQRQTQVRHGQFQYYAMRNPESLD